MNCRFPFLLALFLILGLISSLQADVVLQDDFDDGVVDPAKWISVINGTSTIDEIDGKMVAQTIGSDRSYLVTVGEWNPAAGAITMTGNFELLAENSNMNFWTRASDHCDSNGLPNGGGVLSDGLFVGLHQGGVGGLVKYDSVWPWEAFGETVFLPNTAATLLDFIFTDNGTTVTMTITDQEDPNNTVTWSQDSDFDVGVYHLAYSATDILMDDLVITVGEVVYLPGDADLNGVVNAVDAAMLAANWQTTSGASWSDGDFNNDGIVDDIDATLLAANWQMPTSTAASVPEPSAVVLLLGALTLLLRRRKRS